MNCERICLEMCKLAVKTESKHDLPRAFLDRIPNDESLSSVPFVSDRNHIKPEDADAHLLWVKTYII